jgi:hypothetical protein
MKIRLLVVLVLAASFSAVTLAQSARQTLKGHLVDTVCAKGHGTDAKYVENHTRMCNLMGECVKSGYTLVLADKKMMELDSKGNELALALSKSATKEKDFRVTVTGNVSGTTIAVNSVVLD